MRNFLTHEELKKEMKRLVLSQKRQERALRFLLERLAPLLQDYGQSTEDWVEQQIVLIEKGASKRWRK